MSVQRAPGKKLPCLQDKWRRSSTIRGWQNVQDPLEGSPGRLETQESEKDSGGQPDGLVTEKPPEEGELI